MTAETITTAAQDVAVVFTTREDDQRVTYEVGLGSGGLRGVVHKSLAVINSGSPMKKIWVSDRHGNTIWYRNKYGNQIFTMGE